MNNTYVSYMSAPQPSQQYAPLTPQERAILQASIYDRFGSIQIPKDTLGEKQRAQQLLQARENFLQMETRREGLLETEKRYQAHLGNILSTQA